MAGFYRTFVGPVIIGVSVWCAAGTVAVLSNAETARVVAFAPWWIGIAAAAIAALLPAWRTRPSTTLPALASVLPWVPIPLPAVALVWTGPLAWVPIGAALLVAVGSGPLAWLGRVLRAHEPARATRLAALASLMIAIGAAWAADPRVPGGDEPHYLVITQSLLKDGDLKIENNHTARDYASFFGGTIDPDFLARGRDGVIYSIHAPGVSALVLPAFALFGFRGAQATLMILFALAGALMWRAAWRLTDDTSAAWFAWASVAGSTTMAVMSFMVFPDAPGACAVAAGVWLLVMHRDASNRAIFAVSAALATLPWLHTRFSILAGAVGLALIASLLADDTRTKPVRWRRAALFIVIPVVSAVAWLSMFYALYGTIDPRAPYGPNPEIRAWIWGAVTGLFVDQQLGLIAYAPVLFAAFIGFVPGASRRWRLLSVLCIAIVLVYTMAVASYWMWWAGVPGLPARFLTAALPLLVVPLAVVWARSTAATRTLLLTLLVVSLGITITVLSVDRGLMAWNDRRVSQSAVLSWLSPVVNLPRAWPSFFWNGEVPFLRHAAVMIAMCIAVGAGMNLLVRRYASRPAAARVAVGVSMLVGLMVVVQTGWLLTGSAPLEAASAQLALHADMGVGRAAYRLGNGVQRWDSISAPLRIQPEPPPPLEPASTVALIFATVPGSLSGSVTAGIRPKLPFQRFAVTAGEAQSFPLSLPAGVAVLRIEAESAQLARQLQATLVPVSAALIDRGYARQSIRYPDITAFFLDTNVFPEADGFWVRGG
ncbi:MAG: hypothetical protein ABIP90_02060, partial [Vicinamibacterales bacterium]